MDSIHAAQLQQQLRHNSNEVQSFVKELGDWEDQIKQKDESLKKNKPILKQVSFCGLAPLNADRHTMILSVSFRNCLLLEDRQEEIIIVVELTAGKQPRYRRKLTRAPSLRELLPSIINNGTSWMW